MVYGEAAAGIKVPFSLSVEYFRLPTFGDFVNGVNKYFCLLTLPRGSPSEAGPMLIQVKEPD